MAQKGTSISKAVELLSSGELVAIPTETVYGLAANALDQKAVLQIFSAKQRPFFDPLIVHVASFDEAKKYAEFNDARLTDLAKKFWPGPLTILLPKKDLLPDLVTSGLSRVGIRVPGHDLSLQLLRVLPFPLAAPSANPFGYVSPTEPQHVEDQLGEKVSYILDGGASRVGLESTIVGIENDELCVYRLGGLEIEKIEKLAGPVRLALNTSSDPKAPGQLKNHYAPRTPLEVGDIDSLLAKYKGKKIALLSMGEKKYDAEHIISFNLSPRSDLNEAAVNLFKFLRLADQSAAEIVIAEKVKDEGLGAAINDRLKRAAAH
jgi:L-threonylcarbamoyladenylate synthase